MVGVGIEVPAGQRRGVHDDAVEDVERHVGQDALDDADAVPVAV
jgi:hypothetical protein